MASPDEIPAQPPSKQAVIRSHLRHTFRQRIRPVFETEKGVQIVLSQRELVDAYTKRYEHHFGERRIAAWADG